MPGTRPEVKLRSSFRRLPARRQRLSNPLDNVAGQDRVHARRVGVDVAGVLVASEHNQHRPRAICQLHGDMDAAVPVQGSEWVGAVSHPPPVGDPIDRDPPRPRLRHCHPYDTDSAFQYRIQKGEPLQYARDFRLGTLDQDMKGLEIIRYAAPTIVISAVGKGGTAIKT